MCVPDCEYYKLEENKCVETCTFTIFNDKKVC